MKNGKWKEIVIGLIVAVASTFLLLYKIDEQYMWTDEVYSYEIGEIISETGKAVLPTGQDYPRSSFYHHLMALSMKVFGETSFASRVINIPFILGTMLIIYLVLREKNKLLGLSGSLLYLTTNSTIAIVRETRMYSATTFFLALTALAVYKGIVEVKKGKEIKIKNLRFRINWYWTIVALFSFYMMFDTQPLTLIFGFGLILFYILKYILESKKESLFFAICLTAVALVGLYFRYDTLNPIDLYFSLSPDWAQNYPPAIPYYSFLLLINLPWCFLLSPVVLFIIGKKQDTKNIYVFSIFFTMLFVLSLLQAQAERYIFPIIPLLITLSLFSLHDFYLYLKEKNSKFTKMFLVIISIAIIVPQSIYCVKELNEIDTYTKYSVYTNKKLQFNDVRDYLQENWEDGDYIIGDFHSIYTLYWMDFDVSYFLLPEDDIHWKWGDTDAYFGIPLMNYERDLQDFIDQATEEGKTTYIVIRDERLFNDIEEIFYDYREEKFIRPSLYIVN